MTTAQRPDVTIGVNLTNIAAEQVKQFMATEQVSEGDGGLRVSVLPGGCSGFKYGLNIEEHPLDDDIIVKIDGLRLFVDTFSAQYLDGTTIDYASGMQGAGFTFNNTDAHASPKLPTSCTAATIVAMPPQDVDA